MATTKHAGTLVATVFLYCSMQTWLASCAAITEDVQPDSKPATVGYRNPADSELEERVRRLEAGISLLQCGPPLKALMQSARKLCTNGGIDSMGKKCDEKRLKLPIENARQELGRMNVGDYLLTMLRHEVIYMTNGIDISEQRKKRLRIFASEPRQSTTRYLIVTGAEDGEQRAQVVQDTFSAMIRAAEVGHDISLPSVQVVFEKPWLMRLPLSRVLGADRPLPPGEPNDISKAVFLIRTDCQQDP